jgi:hypothetical protein
VVQIRPMNDNGCYVNYQSIPDIGSRSSSSAAREAGKRAGWDWQGAGKGGGTKYIYTTHVFFTVPKPLTICLI